MALAGEMLCSVANKKDVMPVSLMQVKGKTPAVQTFLSKDEFPL